MSKQLTSENLIGQFPSSMSETNNQYALAVATAEELIKLYNVHDMLAIYARIDELDELLLDILAKDFNVDCWDSNYPADIKRSIFKNSWNVHYHKGTVGSVETFLLSIFKNVAIKEWFDYGGDPYYFKISVNNKYPGALTKDGYKIFFNYIEKVKPARAKLEDLHITHNAEGQQYAAAGIIKTYKKITVPLAAGIEVI